MRGKERDARRGRCHRRAPLLLAAVALVASAALPMPLRAQAAGCGDAGLGATGCAAATSPDPAGAAPLPLPAITGGNPVHLVSGNKYQRETDYRAPAPSALAFLRHYNSALVEHDRGLGPGWSTGYDLRLRRIVGASGADGQAPTRGFELVQGDGRRLRFDAVGTNGTPDATLWRTRHASDGVLRVPLALLALAEGRVDGNPRVAEARARETAAAAVDASGPGALAAVADAFVTWQLPDGRAIAFHGALPVRIDGDDGRRLTLRYRGDRLVAIDDDEGRKLRLEWTPRGTTPLREWIEPVALAADPDAALGPAPGRLARLLLPDGGAIGFDYDARGNLARLRHPDGSARRYRYDDPEHPHRLTAVVDRTGQAVGRWEYDEAGRVVVAERVVPSDGTGERLAIEYLPPPFGETRGATRVRDGRGREALYRWENDPVTGARLLSGEGEACLSCPATGTRHAYDADGRLAVTSDANGHARLFEHDALGRLVAVRERDADGRLRLVEQRRYEHADTTGRAALAARPTRVERPSVAPGERHTVDLVWDTDGRLVELVERGHAPRLPDGAALHGDAARTLDPRTLEHASIERRLRLERDGHGRVVALDGPRADVDDRIRFGYDASGRLERVAPPATAPVAIEAFDAGGRPRRVRVGEGRPWTLVHDAAGRLVEIARGERRLRLEHDAGGRLLRALDPEGRELRRGRDAETVVGSIRGALDALAMADGLARAALDAKGRTASLVDARANLHWRLRDDFGRLAIEGDPDRGLVEHRHDAAGNVVLTRAAGGVRVETRHDAANRLLWRRAVRAADTTELPTRGGAADGTGTTTRRDTDAAVTAALAAARVDEHRFAYDAAGRLVLAENAASRERFVHDADGRLIEHAREIDGRRYVTAYSYDASGRLLDKTLPDGQRLRHHYHESGPNAGTLRAITRLGAFGGLFAETLLADIDLDASDGTSGHLAHNGRRTLRRHRPDGTLAEIETTDGIAPERLGYRFDADGRLARIDAADSGGAGGARYAYDATGRLALAEGADGSHRYGWDAVGNRVRHRHEAPDGRVLRDERLDYPAPGHGNRLLARRGAADGDAIRYRHDARGAPDAIGDERILRDPDGRPVARHRGERLVATYRYNAFGERVAKRVHGADGTARVTRFLHDGHTLAAEIADDGRVAVQYLYLAEHVPVARLAGRRVHAIETDHRGAPVRMTDEDGRSVWAARHAPFGETTVIRADVALRLRLPGQYADEESGTHHNYLRAYDPASGRYRGPDPIGLAGGANLYAYAANDPVGRVDPFGLAPRLIGPPGATVDTGSESIPGPAKPAVGESDDDALRRFGYFALWIGEQYHGYTRGFLTAAGETVLFARDVLRHVTDASLAGLAVDVVFEDPPPWLPSFERFDETNERVVEVADAIREDPSLVWQAIAEPYVAAWAECRYGEAIGRGAFEAATALLPAGLAARLATLSRASRVATLADVMTVLRRGEALAPEEHAAAVRELVGAMRAEGRMGELVEAARGAGTVEDLVRYGGLNVEELRLSRADDVLPSREVSGEQSHLHSADGEPDLPAEPIPLTTARFGHTFRTHGQDQTITLTHRARGSERPIGQFLDDQQAARFILEHLHLTKNGAVSVPVPDGFLARVIMPDGTYRTPTTIRLVPGGKGVKTAYPEL